MTLFLLFIFFSISFQINDSHKLRPFLQDNTVIYGDNKGRFQSIVSQSANQTSTSGVELVGNVTYVVDGDTLDINGIRV
jgi:hypothetical protein